MSGQSVRGSNKAISNLVFTAVAIFLLVTTVAGFSLYATKNTVGITTTVGQTSSITTTITTTATSQLPQSAELVQTPGFYNSSVVVFTYAKNYNCTPSILTFFANQTAAAKLTSCEVGAGQSNAEQGAAPLWVIVPAYAGLSIFGVSALGASPLGFPTFNNATLVTDCGAGGTAAGCPDHPNLLYSPFFTAVEQHINITNGYGGLPEGVLPTPSHDHLIDCCFSVVPWYTIVVLDFDPNIFPNAVTGECTQVVPSNQTDPTQNCLSNYSGLVNALITHSNSTSTNANNPIWQTLGGPTTQVVIP
ncbi:MAG: hypothetical protein ACREBS_04690, partial [Nitrososphaerales archaeon]